MTNNHTELPWSARQGEDTNWWFVLEGPDDNEIGSGDGGLEEDDAHLIVTAVNYHHRLREALGNIVDEWVYGDDIFGPIQKASVLLAELDRLEKQ